MKQDWIDIGPIDELPEGQPALRKDEAGQIAEVDLVVLAALLEPVRRQKLRMQFSENRPFVVIGANVHGLHDCAFLQRLEPDL